MTEMEFAEKIRAFGGRAYIVGGYVRDMIMVRPPHDKDYVVTGICEKDFLQNFPRALKVGASFPVYLAKIDGKKSEVAFARAEKKIGVGYRGFEVSFSPDTTIEEDLFRRDTTINSMAIHILSNELIDPYGGKKDIELGIIRATSEHFGEDPVRALRAARQAAELSFQVEPYTLKLMRLCKDELLTEPTERIFLELKKALGGKFPSVFFRTLNDADLLEVCFPEIFALIGKTQPKEFHPEGDAFEHTMQVLDFTSQKTENVVARFAALVHDIGKGITPKEMLPHHYNHENTGLTVLEGLNRRMTLPRLWLKPARFVIKNHMRAARVTHPGKMADILLGIAKIGFPLADFKAIIEADSKELPFYLERGEELTAAMIDGVTGKEAPPEIEKPRIKEWLRQKRIEIFQKSRGQIRQER